jgi:hypothetical protein
MATLPAQRSKPKRKPAAKPAPAGTPNVIADFIFDDGALFIAVENIGDAPALKVNTRFSAPLRGVEGRVPINAMAMFTNIEFLAPHKAITTFLDTSAAYFRREEPRKIAVTLTYRDAAKKKYTTTIHHDLSIYADIGYIRRARRVNNLDDER